MDQHAREERLQKFRAKKFNFLIVTDLAARGIDIPLLQNVINFDFPTTLKLFIHRSGRTARAGQKGTSYTLISQDEMAYLHDLSVFVGKKFVDTELDTTDVKTNPNVICYGSIPQLVMDEYNEKVTKLLTILKTQFEPLISSMKKSIGKYNKTRDPASSLGTTTTHGLVPKTNPLLTDRVNKHEEALDEFRKSVSNYKPKVSGIEIGILKAKDEAKIGMMKEVVQQQTLAVQAKNVREQMQKQIEAERIKQHTLLENN